MASFFLWPLLHSLTDVRLFILKSRKGNMLGKVCNILHLQRYKGGFYADHFLNCLLIECDRLDTISAVILRQLQTSLNKMKESDSQAELQSRAKELLSVISMTL